MADRAVYASGKDGRGNITKVCGAWGSVSTAQAIVDIRSGTHRYFVELNNNTTALIEVVSANPPYLRTNWDRTTRNNLDDLQNC